MKLLMPFGIVVFAFTKNTLLPTKPKLLVVISDPHIGSDYGLMPPNFHTKAGNEIGLNPLQYWLWHCWQDAWQWLDELAGKDQWSLVLNGDLIDGYHHGTKELWSHDESEHGSAAFHALKTPCKRAYSVYLTEGTESHTKGHEHALACQLEADGANVIKPELGAAWQSLNVEVNGTLCAFDHHISTSMRPYLEASALSIHMGAVRQERARSGHAIPRVIGRAHRHKFGAFDDGYGLIFVSPPWQALTRYGRKVVTHAVPQVGMVVLDWRNCGMDEVPTLHKRLYTIKQQEICKI